MKPPSIEINLAWERMSPNDQFILAKTAIESSNYWQREAEEARDRARVWMERSLYLGILLISAIVIHLAS